MGRVEVTVPRRLLNEEGAKATTHDGDQARIEKAAIDEILIVEILYVSGVLHVDKIASVIVCLQSIFFMVCRENGDGSRCRAVPTGTWYVFFFVFERYVFDDLTFLHSTHSFPPFLRAVCVCACFLPIEFSSSCIIEKQHH